MHQSNPSTLSLCEKKYLGRLEAECEERLHVLAPVGVRALRRESANEVKVLRVVRRLGARVRDVALYHNVKARQRASVYLNVEALCNVHGVLRSDVQLLRADLEETHRIERLGLVLHAILHVAAQQLGRLEVADAVLHLLGCVQ